MRAKTLWVGLSLMVVLSLWTGRLAAQEVFVAPTVPYIPDHHEPQPPIAPRPPPPLAKHPLKRAMNHYGLGCQPDPWGFTGSFHTEMNWLFGSSRSWFLEGCVPNQPCADRRAQQQQR